MSLYKGFRSGDKRRLDSFQGRKNAPLLELLICEYRMLLEPNMPMLRMGLVSLQKLVYLIILIHYLTQQILSQGHGSAEVRMWVQVFLDREGIWYSLTWQNAH